MIYITCIIDNYLNGYKQLAYEQLRQKHKYIMKQQHTIKKTSNKLKKLSSKYIDAK